MTESYRAVAAMILTAASVLAGCGATPHTSTMSTQQREEAKGQEAAHQFEARWEACEGERKVSLTWATTEEHVLRSYDPETDTADYQVLTQADEESYKIEAAGKKVSALVPSAGEAVARYDASLGIVRRAGGEGLRALTAALSEATAAVKVLTTVCEAGTG